MRTDKLSRKVTDFIRLEEGNIGRKSAVVTGALLASAVLSGVLASTSEAAEGHSHHCDEHFESAPHTNHYDGHSDYHWNEYIPLPECN
jgi:hypothetical protein